MNCGVFVYLIPSDCWNPIINSTMTISGRNVSKCIYDQVDLDLYSYTAAVFGGYTEGTKYITANGSYTLSGTKPRYSKCDYIAFIITTEVLPIMGSLSGTFCA